MNLKSGVIALTESCRRKTLNRILEKYIRSCKTYGTDSNGEQMQKATSKKAIGRFPNVAGFCGYYRISVEDLEKLAKEFPEEIAYLYTILEDEALNSGLPPAVLSAYLKKRLGYEKDERKAPFSSEQMSIRFEHDIFNDGE